LPDEDWWNPWAAEGQVNLALMLMVALGFLGASIATQTKEHLAVDVLDRVLSPASARFVKRLTAFTAAGFCFWMAIAGWERITSPDATGDTFPGAKVWWWMVEPVNFATAWMPGDKFGPGAAFANRAAWEAAMVAQGKPWPYGLAFEFVQVGSAFPLWIPMLLLTAAFLIMAIRFGATGLSPAPAPVPDLPQAPRPTSRRPPDIVLAGAFPGAVIALGLAAWLGQGWMIIIASVLLIFMGAPLFIGIGVGTLAGWTLIQDTSAVSLVTDMFEATKKQEIISIPFFVLAGNLMTHGSIARRLVDFARAVVGPTPGGLAIAAVVACAIFAAISGSSPATVIAIGSIVFPMLVKQGYDERFSLGLLTSAGGLGIIIPPSVPMIVFAVIVSNPGGILGVLSPTDLFLGGFAPGLFIALMLGLYATIRNWPRPGVKSPLPPGADPNDSLRGRYFPDLGSTFVRGVFALLLPVIILGGIYGHLLGSPLTLDVTQAAATSVVYAMLVELLIHRELKIQDIPKVCVETATMIGSLFLILVIAISLNKLLAELEVPQAAAEAVLAFADDPIMFLILVNLFLLMLGTVMDIVSAILIVAPLLAPIAAQYGIHPVHFGIMFIVNLEIGYLTPPMGINLFVASTTFKRNLIEVIRGVAPFLALMLFCLGVVAFVPRLAHDIGVPVPGLPALLDTQVVSATGGGGRTADEVVDEARRRLADLRGCVPGIRTERRASTFAWTIQPDGTSTEVALSNGAFETPEAVACTERAIQTFQFPPVASPEAAKVTLTLEHVP
jgi:C4-dicarboxylate transporter DctM subunit